MQKLAIRPNAGSYRIKRPNNDVLSVTLQGGLSRQRQDKIGTPVLISVSWMADESGYTYLNAFFNTIVKKGSLPFLCDLVLDKPALTEHTCRYVPGSFELTSTIAYIFNCSAQFEVLPIVPDEEFDTMFVGLYETYGVLLDSYFAGFSRLANVEMPRWFV